MTATARNLEAAEYHRAGDEQDDDGDHGAGQVPDAARPVHRVHPVGPEGRRQVRVQLESVNDKNTVDGFVSDASILPHVIHSLCLAWDSR